MTSANERRWRAGVGALVVAVVALGGSWTSDAQERQERPRREPAAQTRRPAIDPQADRLLRSMSQHLASMRAFRVDTDSALEVVLESGQRLQYLASSRVTVRRPDRLRSERRGALADLTLYYDGDSITLHGRRANVWATTSAPRTLDQALDFAREQLDLDAPGGDLLTSDVYRTLMTDVTSGMYVGTAEVRGVDAHHVAYRTRSGTDFQVWIQDGATPLPLRYVVVSTDVRSEPQFQVDLHDWDTRSPIADADFAFEPPAGARRIEFLGAQETAALRDSAEAPRGRGEAAPAAPPRGGTPATPPRGGTPATPPRGAAPR